MEEQVRLVTEADDHDEEDLKEEEEEQQSNKEEGKGEDNVDDNDDDEDDDDDEEEEKEEKYEDYDNEEDKIVEGDEEGEDDKGEEEKEEDEYEYDDDKEEEKEEEEEEVDLPSELECKKCAGPGDENPFVWGPAHSYDYGPAHSRDWDPAYSTDWDTDWPTDSEHVTTVESEGDADDTYFGQEDLDSRDRNQSRNVFYQAAEGAPVYTGKLLRLAMASQVSEVRTEYFETETEWPANAFCSPRRNSKDATRSHPAFYQVGGAAPVYTGQLLNALITSPIPEGGIEYFEPFEMESYSCEPDLCSIKENKPENLPSGATDVTDLEPDESGENPRTGIQIGLNKGGKLPEDLHVEDNSHTTKDDWTLALEMSLIL